MAEIAAGGHGEMPPLTLTADEIRHLKIYIDSLSPP
jgi:hypothetical protein